MKDSIRQVLTVIFIIASIIVFVWAQSYYNQLAHNIAPLDYHTKTDEYKLLNYYLATSDYRFSYTNNFVQIADASQRNISLQIDPQYLSQEYMTALFQDWQQVGNANGVFMQPPVNCKFFVITILYKPTSGHLSDRLRGLKCTNDIEPQNMFDLSAYLNQ